jgi:hypothetical protein
MPYRNVKAWRKRVKQLLTQSFGGRCGCCSYDSCIEALEFHHLDPKEKDLGVSSWATTASFEKLAAEVEKCVLLCCRCHREVHAGYRQLPQDIPRFDPALFSTLREQALAPQKAAATLARKRLSTHRGSWDGVDVLALRKDGVSWATIAKAAGVSPAAVQGRYKKLLGT